MNYILIEQPTVSTPKNVKEGKNHLRMECILQTVNERNKNNRIYSRDVIQEGINTVQDRIKEGSFLGELDHPTDTSPVRQMTVLYQEASHKILELGWDNNNLIGTVETLSSTNHGRTLKGLVTEDDIPVGFSFRGMGDVRSRTVEGEEVQSVISPITVITWDSVSNPSHANAKIQMRIDENFDASKVKNSLINEGIELYDIEEKDNMICTENGVCYLPEAFDKLVEKRVIKMKNKFKEF